MSELDRVNFEFAIAILKGLLTSEDAQSAIETLIKEREKLA